MLCREPLPDGRTTVVFALPSDNPPGEVSVVGSFNDWTPGAHPLRMNDEGEVRSAVLVLEPGEHHFRYLASDGLWADEPDADLVTETGSVLRCATESGTPLGEPVAIPARHGGRAEHAGRPQHGSRVEHDGREHSDSGEQRDLPESGKARRQRTKQRTAERP